MAEPYDVHFCFPVHELNSDRIKLTPFIPSIHSYAFCAAAKPHPELSQWVAMGPFASASDFSAWLEDTIRRDPTRTCFAVFDKGDASCTAEGADPVQHCVATRLAGVIGLLNASPANLSVEIGYVWTLPPFQRTHVTTHAVGLLLQWAFADPAHGGLGLRRVQWQADIGNERSWRAAEKMGFKREVVKRWERVVPPQKHGIAVREVDPKRECGGRHTIMLSVCWEEWDQVNKVVRTRMSRR